MNELIDISLTLDEHIPVWPGGVGFKISHTALREEGADANVSKVEFDVHVGTHVDAPWHFVDGAKTVESLSLHDLIGPCTVVDVGHVRAISRDSLAGLGLASGTRRLLLKTANSQWWADGCKGFRPDYVALTDDGARWVVNNGLRLVGVDYLSVRLYRDTPETHKLLLSADVVVVEGLNLAHVDPGDYELICPPIKILGADGAPARAVLRR